MTTSCNIDQHLEMMLNKRSRCEDWVTSVSLRKQYKGRQESKDTEAEANETIDNYSDVRENSEVPSRRIRKAVANKQFALILCCEWYKCDVGSMSCKVTYMKHVADHVSKLNILKMPNGNRTYKCSWETCDFRSVDSSEMIRHVTFHAYHTILKATASQLLTLWDLPECPLATENANCLPDLSSPFVCQMNNCEFETNIFVALISHVNVHVDSLNFVVATSTACRWRGCTKFKCRRKADMKVHLKRHTGEKALACPTCGTMFTTNTKFMDHCNRKAPLQDECNQCQYCLRYYSNDRLLRDHMRYHINSQKCSFCEMTFSTPAVLANHVRYKHINARPFQCSQCSYSSVKADDCHVHMTTHEIEPKYRCQADECNYTCRSVMALKKHFNSIHLKANSPIYRCHLCEKEYNRGPSLGMHLREVHKLERLPGHSRFRYMESKDGFYRLQVERYESLESNNFKLSTTNTEESSEMKFVFREEFANDKTLLKKYTISLDHERNTETRCPITVQDVDENSVVQEQSLADTDCQSGHLIVDLCDSVISDNGNMVSQTTLAPIRVTDEKTTVIAEQRSVKLYNSKTSIRKKKLKRVNLSDSYYDSSEIVIKYEIQK